MTIDPGGVNEAAATTVTPAAYTTSGVIDGTVRAAATATPADGTPSYTPRPTIIPRSAWGASAGGTCSAPLVGSTTRGIVVHHTAGSNSYTAAESAKIVRGVQAYHVNGHDWCDIGYNFLVDKYGQIFEGRKGGIDRNIRAAHSGNNEVNTYTTGISMMGDYDKSSVPEALKSAMVKLVGWRMGTTYLKAKGTYKVTEKNLTLNMIAGHRNVVGTACPGKYAYAWLSESGGLRDRVEAYIVEVLLRDQDPRRMRSAPRPPVPCSSASHRSAAVDARSSRRSTSSRRRARHARRLPGRRLPGAVRRGRLHDLRSRLPDDRQSDGHEQRNVRAAVRRRQHLCRP